MQNLSKLPGSPAHHDLSLKIPLANPMSPDDAIQVVLENPNHETADVRIIFHLDDPSKITGGGALGIDRSHFCFGSLGHRQRRRGQFMGCHAVPSRCCNFASQHQQQEALGVAPATEFLVANIDTKL